MPAPPPLRFYGIDHVVLKVTDIERALRFYVDVLGLKLERIIEDAGIYQLRCGRNIIDLQVQNTPLAPPETRGIDHVCLLMDGDFAVVLAHLDAHGVALAWGPVELYGATGFGTSVYVCDPDGHTIELKADHAVSPLRTSSQEATRNLTRTPPERRR